MQKRHDLVLIVDDEEEIRAYVKAILVSEGYHVIEARDGFEALRLVQTIGGELSLVITDIKMPQLDGISLAKMVRDVFPGMPVLFMSGDWPSLPTSDDLVLTKPFTVQQIKDAISGLLPGRAPSPAPGPLAPFSQ